MRSKRLFVAVRAIGQTCLGFNAVFAPTHPAFHARLGMEQQRAISAAHHAEAGAAVAPPMPVRRRRAGQPLPGRGQVNNVGVLDTFLDTFTTYIDSGFGLIKGEVGYLSSTLIVIDITLAGLFWAWGVDEDILQRLVKKTLYIGFFAFIITNFNSLSAVVFNSFTGLGLKAGGSTISTATFLQPGHLAQVGLDAGQPLLDAASQMMGFTSFFANFVQIAVLMVSWLLVLIAFFILAVQLFVTLIERRHLALANAGREFDVDLSLSPSRSSAVLNRRSTM
jgi:hypothetical protein